ncbi:MAG: DUF1189 family protein [Elusimicrobiaceae bacterium]|nr:DUF1189 family protein [Elusimicrobiaceae bacterium]
MLWAHLQTIFSFHAYHRLAQATRWQVIGFVVYLGMLSLLVSFWASGAMIRKNLPIFLKNFPQVTFEKGILTNPQKPIFARIPGGDFKLAFDATRTTPPTTEELVNQNILFFVSANTLYTPGANGVQTHPLPSTFSFTTTQNFLTRHQSLLTSYLVAGAALAALFLIPLVFMFDFCLALLIGMFFRLLTQRCVSYRTLSLWAIFLQGPLAILWYVRLWHNIPLFLLAQIILCIIYIQQIFNLIPEGNSCA